MQVVALAKQTVCGIYEEVARLGDLEDRGKLAKWAIKSDSAERIGAMVNLARSEPGIAVAVADLDRDPWLLNVANGTLDLHTGRLRPHDPADLLTKLAPVTYDPSANCPVFEKFLAQIMNSRDDLVAYLQRWAGYTITGDVSEQELLFCYGIGANGKSTLFRVMRALLGDYYGEAAPGLLLERGREEHPTQIADLMGRRMVATTEVGEGKHLAEELVKRISGESALKGRWMRQDFFDFEATHKLWLAANHKPIIKGTDYAIWRRIPVVPFEVVFTDDSEPKKDLRLFEKLQEELPGILAWAVRGCLEWQRIGLSAPEAVQAATEAYRAEMDTTGDFLAEHCTVGPAMFRARSSDLYALYKGFAERDGERPLSQKLFIKALESRGFTRRKENTGIWWYGLAIREDSPEATDIRLS